MTIPFCFEKDFQPVAGDCSLWKIKLERPLIWTFISQVYKDYAESIQSKTKCEGQSAPEQDLLEEMLKKNVSFSHFCDILLQNSSLGHGLAETRVLASLMEPYQELIMIKDLPEEKRFSLGSEFALQIQCQGNPQPKYHWWFFPNDGDKWQLIEGNDCNSLEIHKFDFNDAGTYRCSVQHCMDTKHGAQGIYSKEMNVQPIVGDIWIKAHPESQRAETGDTVKFEVEAICKEPVTYDWFHNGKVIENKNESVLIFKYSSASLTGRYMCKIKSGSKCVESNEATLEVSSTISQSFNQEEACESIEIISQPSIADKNAKYAIGAKVHLTCLATCKYPLKYEWLKKGISADLTRMNKNVATDVMHVGYGPELLDEIPFNTGNMISFWKYQCVVTCSKTGERSKSNIIKIPVSTLLVGEQCLPRFKIALVISIEEYQDHSLFVDLKSPKNDSIDLIRHLKEMDFHVLSLINLTAQEIGDAVEMLSSFIDSSTFVLFYFNGHAVTLRNELFLAAKDATDLPELQGVIKQQSIEQTIDRCSPLLCVFIYDSCRKELPSDIHLAQELLLGEESAFLKSSFIQSFGTRHTMENYEKLTHGVYMKHLLKHIQTKESVGKLFEMVAQSFTESEDQRLSTKMMPEHKNGLKQSVSLSAPIRRGKESHLVQLHFKISRYECQVSRQRPVSSFEDSFSQKFGVCSTPGETKFSSKKFNGIIGLRIGPSPFENEALLSVSFDTHDEDKITLEPFSFLVVGVNVTLKKIICFSGHEVISLYNPKKADLLSLKPSDGPNFKSTDNLTNSTTIVITNLQTVSQGAVILEVYLLKEDRVIEGSGKCKVKIPIVTNFPLLKMNNILVI